MQKNRVYGCNYWHFETIKGKIPAGFKPLGSTKELGIMAEVSTTSFLGMVDSIEANQLDILIDGLAVTVNMALYEDELVNINEIRHNNYITIVNRWLPNAKFNLFSLTQLIKKGWLLEDYSESL